MWQLQQIEQFQAIYEHGSLSAAARALGQSQPALSRGLQKLEATLGASLFQRHTRQLRPTEFGHIFHRHATRVLRETAGLDHLTERFRAGGEGTVKLGCGPYVPDILSHHLASGLKHQGRHIHLDVHTDHFEALREGLYSYRYDFLVYDARRHKALPTDDVVMAPLLSLPLKVVVPAQWLRANVPAVNDDAAARAFMAQRPWALPRIAPDYKSHTATWFRRMFTQRRGAEFIMPTISACLGLCRAGHALTLAPELLIREDVAANLLAVLPVDVEACIQTSSFRLHSRPLSEAARHVWRLMATQGI